MSPQEDYYSYQLIDMVISQLEQNDIEDKEEFNRLNSSLKRLLKLVEKSKFK